VSLGLAVLVCLLSHWMTGRLCSPASKFYLLDHPGNRSLHVTPTPRTGGIAIISSLVVGLIMTQIVGLFGMYPRDITAQTHAVATTWAIGLVLLIGAVSFWDDRAGLPSGVRFIVHGMAAAGLVWGAGVTVNTLSVPLLGTLPLGWLAISGTILGLMWMTNLYNFMDGMDGFAGGMTVLGFGFLSYIAWTGEHYTIAILALLISAATGGFLYYNMPPARIFMGDVGSVSLGFLAGALSVMGIYDGLFDLWVPLLIFSPFVADATVTLIRRLLRGERVWQAHREHFYQRLVLAGWGHRRTMVAEYVLMLTCGLSAIVYVHVGETWRLAILMGWIVTYSILAWGIHMTEQHPTEPKVRA
jgi:UDP-N-acetylmuramyl pentapeptide phosphotransferase/UDP-N-acetylglucosamine-1-phosphate transferase